MVVTGLKILASADHYKSYDQPMKKLNLFQPDEAAMETWRHSIHQNLELGFAEFATSRLVADCLNEWGYEVHTGIATTGVIGTLPWGDGSPRLAGRSA